MAENLHNYLSSRLAPANLNEKHKEVLRKQDRTALLITSIIGSMYFVYFCLLSILIWIGWQIVSTRPFDPYPFAFLLFVTNITQLILTPLIVVGQNIQNRREHLRAEEEYKTTKTMHQDIEKILLILGERK
ncbi:MAG: Membrane protein-like protein [Candidatus Amesbacteria bacterium GW2011_GWA2_42_12]|uniref:Membrane protein-like protein n=1 Tax=Candidatus Amesbacteria bacterium GW2011_GWA2_42_12 TaxID=1618356 RepID=A0A0G1B6F7_9BACT|nr:MAG: Membrane protein-like protein [Candidatus Amesbacteria bacterium GW2011_GWA2_42_12]